MKRLFLSPSRPTIYVGAALTNAPESFHQSVLEFRERLRASVEVLDFLGLDAPSAQAAFEWDTMCVKACDALVADVSYPSTGVGVEFGVAYALGKPIITLAAQDVQASRFVFGYVNSRHFTYRYASGDDALEFVLASLRKLFPRMK